MSTLSKGTVVTATARVGSTTSGTFQNMISAGAPASPVFTRVSGIIQAANSSNVQAQVILTHTTATDSGTAIRIQFILASPTQLTMQGGTIIIVTADATAYRTHGPWNLTPGNNGVVYIQNLVVPPGWFLQGRISSGSGTLHWGLTEENISQS